MITELLTSIIGPIGFTTLIIGVIIIMVAPSIGTIISSTWSAILEFAKPLLVAVSEGIVFFIKEFVKGCGVCLSNLSTLSVLLVAIVASGWYFQTWNDKIVLAPFKQEISILQKKVQTCTVPVAKKKGR